MDINTFGRILVAVGVVMLSLGALFMLMGRLPVVRHLGHLPGDVHVQRGGFACFFPIVSMIVISLLLSLALNLIVRVINR